MITITRNALLAVLVTLVALGGASPAGAVAGFGDVEAGQFYTVPVQWMVDEGITTGVSPSCFEPDRAVTRGEGIVFLWRFDGERWGKTNSFSDVTADWMIPAVKWGERKDIITGIAPGIFGPSLPMTRRSTTCSSTRNGLASARSNPAHSCTSSPRCGRAASTISCSRWRASALARSRTADP